jgi:hypothetical protein
MFIKETFKEQEWRSSIKLLLEMLDFYIMGLTHDLKLVEHKDQDIP